MVLQYFHGSTLRAHLGITKTLGRVGRIFYCPGMRSDVCDFMRRCQECQRAKPAQDSRVGVHSREVVEKPLERVFIDFFGPIVRSRRGNIAVLVELDGFSKFVSMYPVRKISSELVKNCLLGKFFPSFGVLKRLFLTMTLIEGGRRFRWVIWF
jgi:hypothetical protein